MKKILIIEDDEAIAKLERDFLMVAGYEISIHMNGIDGLQEALTGQYNLILLDLMLPDMDGLEICEKIRDKVNVPIPLIIGKRNQKIAWSPFGHHKQENNRKNPVFMRVCGF